jgi:hypothetical protein
MSEFGELMVELNGLDDQISTCIAKFEEALRGKLTISIEVPFDGGHLAWRKINSVWHICYSVNGFDTPLASAPRMVRLNGVWTGFEAFLKRIRPALEENIIARRQALQAFSLLEKNIDEAFR